MSKTSKLNIIVSNPLYGINPNEFSDSTIETTLPYDIDAKILDKISVSVDIGGNTGVVVYKCEVRKKELEIDTLSDETVFNYYLNPSGIEQ